MRRSSLIALDSAWSVLRAALPAAKTERIERRGALGRTLAEPLRATTDSPAWDASAMDGYALAGEIEPGTVLAVSATIAAGEGPGAALKPGTAAKIMTGAPVPTGADRVVPVEATDRGQKRVRIAKPVAGGAHIRRGAEVFRRGDELLASGALLTPAALAVLASQGYEEVMVVAPPRVALLSTGDEVVPPESDPAPGQLRNSHADFLRASCRWLGIESDDLGIVPDRREAIEAAVARGLDYDLLLVTGGVSKGDFDFVPEALATHGCKTLFHGVAIRPGKPLLATRHDHGLALGLPGNPGSVVVAFTLFVQPLLRSWTQAAGAPWRQALRCELGGEMPGNPGPFDRFLPGELRLEGGRFIATPTFPTGSHDLVAFARANVLLRLRPGDSTRRAGGDCDAIPLPGV